MRHCPICNNSIDASFGMIQCSNCQTVLFVDFGGNVIIGGNDEGSLGESDQSLEPIQDIELPQTDYSEVIVPEGVEADPFPEPALTDWEPIPAENQEPEAIESQIDDDKFEHPVVEPNFSSETPVFQSDTPQALNQPPIISSGTKATQLKMIIDGIDVSSLRRGVLEVLQDHRLGLVRDELAGGIKDGRLVINGLNPVKASFIMNSLKGMALEIKWEMYAEDSKDKD